MQKKNNKYYGIEKLSFTYQRFLTVISFGIIVKFYTMYNFWLAIYMETLQLWMENAKESL